MLRRVIGLVQVTIGALVLASIAGGYYLWLAPTEALSSPRMVSIKRGDTVRAIAAKLRDARVVRNALAMRIYVRLSGQASRLQPGDYAFRGGENVPEVVRHLVKGDFVVVTVTIPEGMTVHQIADRLERAGLACDDDFAQAARNGALVRGLGLAPLGAEGYLFPATYDFPPSAGIATILGTMLRRFFEILTPEVEERQFELGLTTRELVTLASIVEKEARMPSERPLIASVLYNRLRLNMPLQSDPTAQYSFEGTAEPVLEAVHTPSAFNTYDFVGLPPGPIANPGLASIRAVLYPARTSYLYFVARNDGTHIFSRSLEEHNRAIAGLRRAAMRAPATAARASARLTR